MRNRCKTCILIFLLALFAMFKYYLKKVLLIWSTYLALYIRLFPLFTFFVLCHITKESPDIHKFCFFFFASCRTGEKGIVISQIQPTHIQFYVDQKADDEKKTVYDAFEVGDRHFNFGDIVYVDNEYFVYFQDRTGDTFRYV